MIDNSIEKRFIVDLLEKRIIYLSGEINGRMAEDFGKAIIWLNALDPQKEITLYIDSSGGHVPAGLDIYDAIKHSEAPINAIVYSQAYSMAAIILQACKKRSAMPHSLILIHYVTVPGYKTYEFSERLEEVLGEIKEKENEILWILADRTGKSIEEIAKKAREDKPMSVEEAKEFGLIDEIL